MRSRLRRFIHKSNREFSPLQIFTPGVFGVWLDQTDPTTWFQDTAGTIPATTLGDPIGRINDKSGNSVTALQSTSAARPAHGRMPLGGVRNMLTRSNDFTNVAWTASGTGPSTYQGTGSAAVRTANYGLAPDGTMTACRLQLNLNGGVGVANRSGIYISRTVSLVPMVSSIYLKPLDSTTKAQLEGSATCFPAMGSNPVVTTVTEEGDGWYRISATATATLTTGEVRIQINGAGTIDTLDCLIWHCQLEQGSTATNDQLVVQGCDVTEEGIASVPCVWYDGVDDFLDLTASGAGLVRNTGRFTTFASGLHTKALTSTQFQFVATMSASAATRASIGGAATNISTVQARRTAAGSYAPSLESPATAFTPYVRTAVLSYVTRLGELRANGALADSDATFFTAGNTEDSDSQNVYVARASTAYFGGFMTGVIAVKGVTLSDAQILQTERYLGNQIGVTI